MQKCLPAIETWQKTGLDLPQQLLENHVRLIRKISAEIDRETTTHSQLATKISIA